MSEPKNDDRHRREDIARMTQQTLMQLVASRPGQVTAAMIEANAAQTFDACSAIHDACVRFCLSPQELAKLEEQEQYEIEQAAHDKKEEAARALADAKKQAKKDAQARAKLAEIEAAKGAAPK